MLVFRSKLYVKFCELNQLAVARWDKLGEAEVNSGVPEVKNVNMCAGSII